MIPVKLELQGLYSYKQKQTINFEQLTAAGLFGIFGAVGSGKSSILEAIMLSLYGNTERLAVRGEKTSMVNLQSDFLSISFEFKAGKNNSETYKATYISKRNKKNFEDIRPAEHNFYHKTPEGWSPIALDGEKLVGMKMEHFRQTVIIPQGKFRDFIEQKPLARAEMMKELFGLERFDLSAQTAGLFKKNNVEKIQLQTRLQNLEEVNSESLHEREIHLLNLTGQKSSQEKQLAVNEKAFSSLKTIREKHLLLIDLEAKNRQLLTQQPAIDQKREELKMYRKAVAEIRPVLNQLKEKEIEIEKYDVSFSECSRWKTDYAEKVTSLEAEEQKLKADQNKKSEREAKIRDLQKIIVVNSLKDEVTLNKRIVDQLIPKSENLKKYLTSSQQQIERLEAREEQITVPNAQSLADLKNIIRDFHQLGNLRMELLSTIDLLANHQSAIRKKISILEEFLPADIKDFGKWIHHLNQNIEELQQQRDLLLQQQGLAAYAGHLETGESCPLCGSKDHPQPLSHHFDDDGVKENHRTSQRLKTELEGVRDQQSSYEKELLQLQAVTSNLDQKHQELSKNEEEKKTLINTINSLGIENEERLTSQLEEYQKAFEEQQGILQQLKQLRRDYQKQKDQFDLDDRQLRTAENKLLALHTSLTTQTGEISFPELRSKYLAVSEERIRQDIDKVQQAIEDLEINLKRNQDRLREARQAQATNLANFHQFQELLAESRRKYSFLQNELKGQLLTYGFSSRQQATDLLSGALIPEQWEIEITSYDNQVTMVKGGLQELNKNQEVVDFKEEIFEQMSLKLQSEKEVLDELKSHHTLIQKEIEGIKVSLQQKLGLETALEKVIKREMNLRELERLFKGNGFVKYVSNIYLKELCVTANQRFMKLTKNSLSLEIDEDNNFWVRDYLNGGKRRLLKSLSGGQTFQASLCLALALAEKVKSLNRADQSFFFLDEGFGALDKASLRTVFEALKSLRHENRVVGIISHVEELQQEIEVYAKVELDGEQGSLISYSF